MEFVKSNHNKKTRTTKMKHSAFSNHAVRKLNFYVYIYSHPITEEVFYVGKGNGNRAFSHLMDSTESRKVDYIRELKSQGLEPVIEILIHGLEAETALRVESSVIDLLGIKNLTNKQGGYKSALFGRMLIEQINSAYNRKKVVIEEPSILIRINQAFRYSMTPTELYDFTRGQWKINPNVAKQAKLAFAIYGGVIQEVYEVLDWYEAGKTYSVRQEQKFLKQSKNDKIKGRYEFIGNLANEKIRKKYQYKSVEHYFKQGNSNPIMYLNL